MKEHPIPLNAEMVRAVLDGTKTQTRRLCKPAEAASLSRVIPAYKSDDGEQRPPYITPGWFGDEEGDVLFCCPFGADGDRLWVRESARVIAARGGHREIDIQYQADDTTATVAYPSRLAPAPLGKLLANGTYREASRILLEITAVRVEQLQDISEEDAESEGIEGISQPTGGDDYQDYWRNYSLTKKQADGWPWFTGDRIASFKSLWQKIYGTDSWDTNPWVWVIEFKEIKL